MVTPLPKVLPQSPWLRSSGIAFGLATQALFLVTVWRLFWFLRDGTAEVVQASLVWNLLLTLQFALPHSLLLWPPMRRWITRWLPSPLYGCLFCAITCASLLVLFATWQGSAVTIWDAEGPVRDVIRLAYYGSWAALLYSLHLTGLGYQTGLTPWWYWVRQLPLPPRSFEPGGAYRFMRHPIYLSFLGLIWFTPRMTLDHAILTGVWTAYIFVGSYLKDERLAFYYGERYRQYQSRVPGYPLLPDLFNLSAWW